jgi:hypothetical protein
MGATATTCCRRATATTSSRNAAGSNLLDGGLGTDTLTGGAGRELIVGGKGDDTISAGTGADVFAFNKGDGKDALAVATGSDDTLSLGGGIRYADLGMRKIGNDLVVDAGTDQVTLKDWYLATTNHRIALVAGRHGRVDRLSRIVDRSDAQSACRALRLQRDRDGIRRRARGRPDAHRWTVASALAGSFVAGSDGAALGGDLAYQYGHSGTLAGIGLRCRRDDPRRRQLRAEPAAVPAAGDAGGGGRAFFVSPGPGAGSVIDGLRQ